MGYPPEWLNVRYEDAVRKWLDAHPGFPWVKSFTEEEKKNWILSIPNNGPQPGIMWDQYDVKKFASDLMTALNTKSEMYISQIGRIRAESPSKLTRYDGWKDVVIEVMVNETWTEVFRQAWSGTPFDAQYAMHDIPLKVLIESQMIDTAFLARYAWANTPMEVRYKDDVAKLQGTINWALTTFSLNTKGCVVQSIAVKPVIDTRQVLMKYEVDVDLLDIKTGYIIKRMWGGDLVVGPDGRVIEGQGVQ